MAAIVEKIRNVTGRPLEECAACIDGWVELAGSTTIGGVTYTRGWAPCKWCELGAKRFLHAVESGQKRWQPESDFTGTDIEPHGEPVGRKFVPNPEWLLEREAAGIPRAALQAITPRSVWPEAWRGSPAGPLLGSLGDADTTEIRRRRELALQAKNQAEQEGSP